MVALLTAAIDGSPDRTGLLARPLAATGTPEAPDLILAALAALRSDDPSFERDWRAHQLVQTLTEYDFRDDPRIRPMLRDYARLDTRAGEQARDGIEYLEAKHEWRTTGLRFRRRVRRVRSALDPRNLYWIWCDYREERGLHSR